MMNIPFQDHFRPTMPSFEQYDEPIRVLLADLDEVSRIFYGKCVEAVRSSSYQVSVVHPTAAGKAAMVILAFQAVCLSFALPTYLGEQEAGLFMDRFFEMIDSRYRSKCYDFYRCYRKIGATLSSKQLYYFAVDIGKYILGFESEGIPSSFPCLSSYISSGIPREILARTDVTHASFAIQELIPRLRTASELALAYCFDDATEIKRIESTLT